MVSLEINLLKNTYKIWKQSQKMTKSFKKHQSTLRGNYKKSLLINNYKIILSHKICFLGEDLSNKTRNTLLLLNKQKIRKG